MQDKRRHTRFKLDLQEMNGKMCLADKVEIIDISLGGVAIKADRRLNIGNEYSIKLGERGKQIEVRGIVVRSELCGFEERDDGESVSVYAAGMRFRDGSAEKVAEFLGIIEHSKKEDVPAVLDRRCDIRFQIVAPGERILSFPAQFKVKDISLSGILIDTDQFLGPDSNIPMSLSLDGVNTVNFNGRVVFCRKMEDGEQAHHEIGVEFSDLTDKDKTLIKTFIDYLALNT